MRELCIHYNMYSTLFALHRVWLQLACVASPFAAILHFCFHLYWFANLVLGEKWSVSKLNCFMCNRSTALLQPPLLTAKAPDTRPPSNMVLTLYIWGRTKNNTWNQPNKIIMCKILSKSFSQEANKSRAWCKSDLALFRWLSTFMSHTMCYYLN